MGRPRLEYTKRVARNTGADSYTLYSNEKMVCNSSRKLSTNQKVGGEEDEEEEEEEEEDDDDDDDDGCSKCCP